MPSPAARSLWADTLPDAERRSFPPLDGDRQVDVAIVGGGLTGLWTAWHLLRRDPSLHVAVLERETIGFGASGRNGGWCSALMPMSLQSIETRHGRAAAQRMQQAMLDNVDDIARFASAVGLADSCHLGGTLTLARSRPQLERLRRHVETMAGYGFDDDFSWLGAGEATALCSATRVSGGVFTKRCATVHPLRLTHAVAGAARDAGAQLFEGTTVTEIGPGMVRTPAGTVRAEVVVRATEGYTTQFAGERRTLLPIFSMMIATEPLSDEMWGSVGLSGRPTFNDGRRLIIYGQRTSDGRIAFGGRGAPYHFGSAVRPEFDTDGRVRELLTDTLRDLFPALDGIEITHHWGGALAAPRDWTSFVRFDRRSGFGTAGGYVGDGLATTHLAGRTLAALITASDADEDRELVRLPWVGHRSKAWEPEPLRWLGVNGVRLAAARADTVERRSDRPSRAWGAVVDRLTGH
jgi:glycine/D-amino acid oxidase-like deaminating enzyme